jgi:hypothetical protein
MLSIAIRNQKILDLCSYGVGIGSISGKINPQSMQELGE